MPVRCLLNDKSLTLFFTAASSVSVSFHLCLMLCFIFAVPSKIILSHLQLHIKHLSLSFLSLFSPLSQPWGSPCAEIHLTINMYNISGNSICITVSSAYDWQKLHSWRCAKCFAYSLKSSLGQTYFSPLAGYCSVLNLKYAFGFLWWIQLTVTSTVWLKLIPPWKNAGHWLKWLLIL